MNSTTPALLVPPVRLGRLLREVREAQGRSPRELSRVCGLAYDEAWFSDLEAGRIHLDEALVHWVSTLYGVDASTLAPGRSQLIIDLDEGVLAVGSQSVPLGHVSSNADEVLVNYLALVYLLRGVEAGTSIPLREVDIDVLSHSLQRNRRDVQHSLGRLISNESHAVVNRSSHLRRRLVVPVAGILVGLTAVGGLLLVRATGSEALGDNNPAVDSGSSSTAHDVPVEIGDAIVLERGGTVTTR